MPLVALLLELQGAGAEALTDALLDCGALSVSSEDARAGTRAETPLFDEPGSRGQAWPMLRLRVLLESSRDAAGVLAKACAAAGIGAIPHYSIEQVKEQDWVRKTRSQFAPMRIATRLWIVPSWHQAPDPAAVNVVLDPGIAFGTGSHPTTRLCLAWLERELRGGETVLDYGCGSGILAIAARKLGAGRVLGVDVDADALAAARENALRNGTACEFVDARFPLELQADLVVANILANPLKLLAGALAAHTAPGGHIALSGILEHQETEVAEAYPWFEFDPVAREDGWALLAGRKKAGSFP